MNKDLIAVLLALLMLIVVVVSAIIYTQHDRLNRGMIYIPAHWEVIDENRK